jgi:hypothetical protein
MGRTGSFAMTGRGFGHGHELATGLVEHDAVAIGVHARPFA